jgi:hypothetical protein
MTALIFQGLLSLVLVGFTHVFSFNPHHQVRGHNHYKPQYIDKGTEALWNRPPHA